MSDFPKKCGMRLCTHIGSFYVAGDYLCGECFNRIMVAPRVNVSAVGPLQKANADFDFVAYLMGGSERKKKTDGF